MAQSILHFTPHIAGILCVNHRAVRKLRFVNQLFRVVAGYFQATVADVFHGPAQIIARAEQHGRYILYQAVQTAVAGITDLIFPHLRGDITKGCTDGVECARIHRLQAHFTPAHVIIRTTDAYPDHLTLAGCCNFLHSHTPVVYIFRV